MSIIKNLCGSFRKAFYSNISLALGTRPFLFCLGWCENVGVLQMDADSVATNGFPKGCAQLVFFQLFLIFIYFSSILTLAPGQCFRVE